MPKLGSKKYSYTKKGMSDYKKAISKMKKKKGSKKQ